MPLQAYITMYIYTAIFSEGICDVYRVYCGSSTMKVMVVELMGPSKADLMAPTASAWTSPLRLVLFTCRICWPTFRPLPDRAAEPSGYSCERKQGV